ncbi:unnamed protein product [Brassicogethes aeneus]|uniref:Peptidase S1 domain-containing protein n=1 Tax=Brassicogethes aeneus TaxID=1431903 RepID=A0A9P0AZ48_BRAAE|nr:unnamed protein product [Brassicogethes aeneus]
MLTLVTLATFLLEICSSSPVYNMQPAFITANIGATTGRNIRNLPCISRKNNESGVCMFAIDCVKANGTHLGTCIDRFYFGSCCHIEPLHDITENTIDTEIIPSRVPPQRLSTTSPSTISTPNSGDIVNLINKLGVSNATTETTSTTTEKITTTTKKPIPTTTTTTTISTTTTKKPKVTTQKQPTTTQKVSVTTTEPPVTEIIEKLQTFQSVNGNTASTNVTTTTPIITTIKPVKLTTTTVKPTQRPVTTTKPLTTLKPVTKAPTKPKPIRPVTTTPKPAKVTKVPTKLTTKPVKTTSKPVQVTSKPVKVAVNVTTTTKRPVTSTSTVVTKKPVTTKVTTKKPVVTIKPTKIVTVKTTTVAPTTIKVTTPVTTTIKTTKTPPKSTLPPVTVTTATVITQTSITTQPQVTKKPLVSTTESNDLPVQKLNVTSILETVNGNPATNEIEAVRPAAVSTTEKSSTKPSLVTWTVADDRKNSTTPSIDAPASNSTEAPEDWVPITTPDGWVLLPSVSPITTNPLSVETNTTTQPSFITTWKTPEETKTPSTSSPTVVTTPPSTTITTTKTPTSSPKPSITYIPLQPSTTEGGVTNLGSSITTMAPEKIENVTVTTEKTSGENLGTTSSLVGDNLTTSSPPISPPVNMSDFTHVCGRRMFPEARIVGGEKSSFGKWPWQISLRQWRTSTYLHKCGAALLNENWAITAAHCVDNVPPSDLLLRLGEHDLSTESEPYLHQERRVQIVASHPQFDPRTFEYDLALLRFYEPVTFQPNILPVCVPQTDENFVGRTAHVTGWGRLYEEGPLPSILQEVSVPVINNSVCESMYRSAGYIEHIPHIFICAGWRRGGFDSCEGDSGGPMVIQREDKRFLLAGVISWGIGCAEPNQPGVYTRISEFRDWINQILQF